MVENAKKLRQTIRQKDDRLCGHGSAVRQA